MHISKTLSILFQDSKTKDTSSGGSKNGAQEAEGETLYDLPVVTMDILRFLSGLTTLYAAPSEGAQEKDTVEV